MAEAMNYRLVLLVIAAVQIRVLAYEESPLAPLKVDASSGPVLTIDNWVPQPAPKPTPEPAPEALPEVVGKTAEFAAPAPAVAAPSPGLPLPPSANAAPAVPPRVTMNEMTGTVAAVDADAKTIRLEVDGGISPQFDYNDQTIVLADGGKLKIDDLQRNDRVVVRYVGKDLIAREIDRVKKP